MTVKLHEIIDVSNEAPLPPSEAIIQECQEAEYGKEVWVPKPFCWCCMDNGSISEIDLKPFVLAGKLQLSKRNPALSCNICDESAWAKGLGIYDERIPRSWCEAIATKNELNWARYLDNRDEIKVQLQEIKKKFSGIFTSLIDTEEGNHFFGL